MAHLCGRKMGIVVLCVRVLHLQTCFCDFQGEVGPAGAPGIPGKEGLVGPKVYAVYLVCGVQM